MSICAVDVPPSLIFSSLDFRLSYSCFFFIFILLSHRYGVSFFKPPTFLLRVSSSQSNETILIPRTRLACLTKSTFFLKLFSSHIRCVTCGVIVLEYVPPWDSTHPLNLALLSPNSSVW